MYPSVSKKDVVLTIWMQFPPSFLIRTSAFQMIRHPKEILEFSLNNFWGYLEEIKHRLFGFEDIFLTPTWLKTASAPAAIN